GPGPRHLDDCWCATGRAEPAARSRPGPRGAALMERIRSVVESELGRFGPVAGMADVVTGWPDGVGEAIARNAWPARIGRDGTLFVHTADAVWAFELQHRAEEIAA